MNIPFHEFRENLRTSHLTNKKYYLQHYLGGLKQLDLRTVLTDSDGKVIDGISLVIYCCYDYFLLMIDISNFKWAWLDRATKTNSSIPLLYKVLPLVKNSFFY